MFFSIFRRCQLIVYRMAGSMLELSSGDDHREGKHKRSGLMARFHQRKR